jgi:23S rRNA pseudouridine1911/1915/1917 synthase
MTSPFIVAEERDYIVIFKPSGMHGAPLTDSESGTLLAWCAERFPDVLAVAGRKAIEGGLLHRLDRETEGLVVLARNQAFYDSLTLQQIEGLFLKEYLAMCIKRDTSVEGENLPGFPTAPTIASMPFVLESAFRPFGPGRRAVRPVVMDRPGGIEYPSSPGRRERDVALDQDVPYRTELLELAEIGDGRVRIRARLARGFRHQIRCHLTWIGLPIMGDRLYGWDGAHSDVLSLSAVAVSFLDPVSRLPLRYEFCSSMDSERIS